MFLVFKKFPIKLLCRKAIHNWWDYVQSLTKPFSQWLCNIVETSPEFLCIRTLFRLMAYISSSCIREEGSPNSQNNFNNYQGQLFCSHVKWIDDKLIELSLSLIHTQKLFLSHFTKFISYQPFRLFPTESEPKITQTLCSRHISGLIKDLCTVLLLITNVRALQIECSRESKAHGILKINIF